MIDKYYLDKLLESYGLDAKKLVSKNNNVLDYGEYSDIKRTLDYLMIELRFGGKNIEKCPSILYRNVDAIKENWEFLKKSNITIYNIETCLHVLSTEPNELRKTYNHVINNYGLQTLNKTTSILSVPLERIKNIEDLNLTKENIISAAISRLEEKEIKKVINVCKDNNIEVTGSVFKQPAEEIEKIVKVCKENNIEITGSVFIQSANSLIQSIDYIKANYGSKYLKPLIINKNVKHLERIFPYLESLGVLETVIDSASILSLKYDELVERKEYIESIGQDMVLPNGKFNSIFGLSKKNYKSKVESNSDKIDVKQKN